VVPPLRWVGDRRIRRGRIPLELRRWEYVDWDNTLAYSHGLFGNVYINLKGREPEGCVEPADYEATRERVARLLSTSLRDPDDGGRIVDQVFRREELYSGPYVDQAPDLVVVMRGYSYMTRGGNELTATEVVTPPKVRHSGNHRLDGMLVMWGQGIRQGVTVEGGNIIDVMPTILSILGIPVPREVDGRVLNEALEQPEQLIGLARRLLVSDDRGRQLTATEERLVRQRLRNLGYFE
jgi:predicted AlkP superfamily phosphohydrolase/phosphomutase